MNGEGLQFFLKTAMIYFMKDYGFETFEKYSILSKVKEDENFNHRNTFSISRIKI